MNLFVQREHPLINQNKSSQMILLTVITDGCDTYLIRKQNLPCSEPRTCNRKETMLGDGDGSEIANYLNDCELRRCVELNELLGEA